MPQLNFKGKTAVENYHYTIPHHTLEFDERLSVLERGQKPSFNNNLIVEGDNLISLKALLPTHAGKVKCVYIDPPYNTGNEGWVYNDNLTQPQFKEWIGQTVGKEGEDANRHDKWCCMMYPRLQLLKELLRDDGIIFVSIDNIEVLSLTSLMDEIFGYENRIEPIIWKKSYGGGSKSKHIVNLHEYVLCYAKKKELITSLELPPSKSVLKYYKYKDSKFEERGPYRTQPLATNSMDERENLRYPIPYKKQEIWPEKQWQWRKERALEALKDDRLVFVEGKNGVTVYYKQYLKDEDGDERSSKPYSIVDGFYTQQGTEEIQAIFGDGKAFSFPKPSGLIKYLLQFATNKDSIILDSFAGSGTTGHATLQLNSEDSGNRKFILIQQPFENKEQEKSAKNICKSITRERIYRVTQGYKFKGKRKQILLTEKLTPSLLNRAQEVLEQIEELCAKNSKKFSTFETKVEKEELRLIGFENSEEKIDGLGGTFTYCRLGIPAVTEYRTFRTNQPSREVLAQYILYTETNAQIAPNPPKGGGHKIGEYHGVSYFLLYDPTNSESEKSVLDVKTLLTILETDKNKSTVIYCEKIWVHRDDREAFEKSTGKSIRVMQLPFHLK